RSTKARLARARYKVIGPTPISIFSSHCAAADFITLSRKAPTSELTLKHPVSPTESRANTNAIPNRNRAHVLVGRAYSRARVSAILGRSGLNGVSTLRSTATEDGSPHR